MSAQNEMSLAVSNLSVVDRYFASLASGDFAALGALLHDDIVWHQPGLGSLSGDHVGKEAVFALFGEFMSRSAGTFRIDAVKDIMENGSLVSATLHFSATAQNRSLSMSGVDLMRVADGTIREVWLFSADQSTEDAFWSA